MTFIANIEVVSDGGFVERGWLQWKTSHPQPPKGRSGLREKFRT